MPSRESPRLGLLGHRDFGVSLRLGSNMCHPADLDREVVVVMPGLPTELVAELWREARECRVERESGLERHVAFVARPARGVHGAVEEHSLGAAPVLVREGQELRWIGARRARRPAHLVGACYSVSNEHERLRHACNRHVGAARPRVELLHAEDVKRLVVVHVGLIAEAVAQSHGLAAHLGLEFERSGELVAAYPVRHDLHGVRVLEILVHEQRDTAFVSAVRGPVEQEPRAVGYGQAVPRKQESLGVRRDNVVRRRVGRIDRVHVTDGRGEVCVHVVGLVAVLVAERHGLAGVARIGERKRSGTIEHGGVVRLRLSSDAVPASLAHDKVREILVAALVAKSPANRVIEALGVEGVLEVLVGEVCPGGMADKAKLLLVVQHTHVRIAGDGLDGIQFGVFEPHRTVEHRWLVAERVAKALHLAPGPL
mmetsp:Transcript_23360/g.62766  ORF Transcript_23360/g.62766 Transcript_23360/m.62766 type:complete len:426 (-) Transcript_23360:12313-13590(-)